MIWDTLYIVLFMFAITGKTAGPNWLKFFRKPMGTPGYDIDKQLFEKILNSFFSTKITI